MKHRKPSRAQRAMASTSLPLAAAAAVASLLAAPAGAAPNDPTIPPTTAPPSPAPAQPGVNEAPPSPDTTKPDPNKPDPNKPQGPSQPGVTTPGQPGVNTPDPVMPNPNKDPRLAQPTQPGVTTPRIAPLPVPGQSGQQGQAQPAVTPDTPDGEQTPAQPGTTPQQPGTPNTPPRTQNTPGSDENTQAQQPETLVQPQQPRWQAPRLEEAPPAPVVEMTGPHQEIGANIDGGALLPGHVANTHHFNNESGYVGTIGYRTPAGAGEAGVSVEYVDTNTVKVTTYTGGVGLTDNKTVSVFDTTQANLAKAAVENWIKEQPGGAAALEAAAQVKLPLQPGDLAPQTVEVGGVTTQWGGSLQY
ncbi:hypothetical protein [Nocardia suismassiliense]|uniref:hypothetical protein n=1 Tax=Nocardia suismassiliense TaxID=2077092 RepID=UPI001F1CAF81|nr:hypothetical protein [Nocardia suismassiliense]